MTLSVICGGFWGDEGKGKVLSYLALKDDPSIVVRAGVGTNAGHTIQFKGKEYKLRMIPSGFINPNTRLLIGAGVLSPVSGLIHAAVCCFLWVSNAIFATLSSTTGSPYEDSFICGSAIAR